MHQKNALWKVHEMFSNSQIVSKEAASNTVRRNWNRETWKSLSKPGILLAAPGDLTGPHSRIFFKKKSCKILMRKATAHRNKNISTTYLLSSLFFKIQKLFTPLFTPITDSSTEEGYFSPSIIWLWFHEGKKIVFSFTIYTGSVKHNSKFKIYNC